MSSRSSPLIFREERSDLCELCPERNEGSNLPQILQVRLGLGKYIEQSWKNINIDIDSEKYNNSGTSKANRFSIILASRTKLYRSKTYLLFIRLLAEHEIIQ